MQRAQRALNFRVWKLHNTMVSGLEILGFTSLGHSARSSHEGLGFGIFRAYLCPQRVRSRVPGFQGSRVPGSNIQGSKVQ